MSDHTPVVRTLSGSPYRSFDEFFAKNGTKAQVFFINPARRTTVIGKAGTRLTFFPFSLCDVFGNPLKEEVEVRLIEIYDRSQMVRSAQVTTSQDRFMETAGILHLQASQNLLPVELCQPVAVDMPVDSALHNPLGVRLFAGSTATTRSFSANKAFDWKPEEKGGVKVRKLGGKKYFSFELNRFHWFSCHNLVARRSNRTMVSARMICPVRELDDQAAFLVFKELNVVARMYPAGKKFTIFNVPANMPAKVLTFGLRDGQLYFGESDFENTSSQLLRVELHPVGEQDLLEALHQL